MTASLGATEAGGLAHLGNKYGKRPEGVRSMKWNKLGYVTAVSLDRCCRENDQEGIQ